MTATVKKANFPFSFNSLLSKENSFDSMKIFQQGKKQFNKVDWFNALWSVNSWKINILNEWLVWYVKTQVNSKIVLAKVDWWEEAVNKHMRVSQKIIYKLNSIFVIAFNDEPSWSLKQNCLEF